MEAIDTVLDRPVGQRALEYKYRFGQAVVFGLPVVALQAWGRALGGPEAERWVALFQALLAGWVVYVAATGMVVEGALYAARGRVTADLVVGGLAVVGYLWSASALVTVPITGRLWHHGTVFDWCVVALGMWSGVRWVRMRREAPCKPGG